MADISKTDYFTAEQEQTARFAKALGHPVRIAILELLNSQSCCYHGDMADELPIAKSNYCIIGQDGCLFIANNYLGFNNKDPRFNDVRVRRAMLMAIDRQAIIKNLYSGQAQAGDDWRHVADIAAAVAALASCTRTGCRW